MFELIPYEKFRDTPSVRFFDITVPTSNKRDLVVHSGPAVSPPDCQESGSWQFYLHPHQEDNLLTGLLKAYNNIEPADLEAMLDLNLKGCFYTTQAAAKVLGLKCSKAKKNF